MKVKQMSALFGSLLLAGVFVSGCSTVCPDGREPRITQVSTIDALLAGNFDGVCPARRLTDFGTLGIGTVDQLDGEMILLDGTVYHVRADGKAYLVPDAATIPFASVVDFRADTVATVKPSASMEEFLKEADGLLPSGNVPAAIRVFGRFKTMKTRSVPRQEKPYPTLLQVTQHQPEFRFENVEGWLVGFRLPSYVRGINVPGWHLHFLTADKASGGHVLAFEAASGTLEAMSAYDYRVILPEGSESFLKTDFTQDRSEELRQAESDR